MWDEALVLFWYLLPQIQYISRKPLCVMVYICHRKNMSNGLLLCCCLFRSVSCIFDLQNREETNVHKAETFCCFFLDIKYWRQLHFSLSFHQCHPPTSLPATCSLFSCPFLCCQKQKHMSTPILKGLFNSTRTKRAVLSAVRHTTLPPIIFTSSIYNLSSVLHMS